MSYGFDRLRALENAQRMLGFNARPGTVRAVTGLSQKEVQRLAEPGRRVRSGRPPSTCEWYHTGSLLQRVEASLFAAHYWRNRIHEFEIIESLIDAYGRYLSCVGDGPLISFDRAFNLVCHLEGNVWGVGPRSLDIAACPRCNARQLIQLGDETPLGECIFCKFVQRFAADARLQKHFPARLLPDFSA